MKRKKNQIDDAVDDDDGVDCVGTKKLSGFQRIRCCRLYIYIDMNFGWRCDFSISSPKLESLT